MDPKLLQQAVELTKQMMTGYYFQRDIFAVLDRMAPDVSWIGPGELEKTYTLDEMRDYFMRGKDSVPTCLVSDFDLHGVALEENHCLVFGSMTVRTTPESQLILEVSQRISLVLRYLQGKFQVVHLHNSNPYAAMGIDEYFPHKIGAESYRYLQQLLAEKLEVLDMIAGNIDGGLKGSNDDSTYSFFYVNEGLPRMLGYTYDEFMKKTGGTAVGAVYPPDLPAALEDCARCFAKGPLYYTEYRIEKKDGSLMWVLDSGRKTVDSEGVTRINSILMDITPLKQALFDLEIERERYRIALQHIVGAMCEYDIEKDLFILFYQAGSNGNRTIERSEISNFSHKLSSGEFTSQKDAEAFLSLCTGKDTGTLEFQSRLLYPDHLWHWVQFGCSVITDHAGEPVRSIGILKDITEERQRNQLLLQQAQRDGLTGLLNHTTVKEVIGDVLQKDVLDSSSPSALLMLDLDRFKEVNDHNGHAYGDKVLMQTAAILEHATKPEGIVGRIGGDEFLILIQNQHPNQVEHITQEIITQIQKIGEEKQHAVTCSIGVAFHTQQEETFVQLFERADQALYHAKRKGRNQAFLDFSPHWITER